MMRLGSTAWALVAALATSGSIAAAQQGDVPDPPDPYVQTQTGMAFPMHVGAAVRHQVVRYSADGADTGIGYQVPRDGRLIAYLSIFVYPAPPPEADGDAARAKACRGVFEGMKRDIVVHEPSATPISERRVSSPASVFKARGWRILYAGGNGTFGGTEQPVREQADLFCYAGGKWLVAYRVTTPAGIDASLEVGRLMRALVWPAALAR